MHTVAAARQRRTIGLASVVSCMQTSHIFSRSCPRGFSVAGRDPSGPACTHRAFTTRALPVVLFCYSSVVLYTGSGVRSAPCVVIADVHDGGVRLWMLHQRAEFCRSARACPARVCTQWARSNCGPQLALWGDAVRVGIIIPSCVQPACFPNIASPMLAISLGLRERFDNEQQS